MEIKTLDEVIRGHVIETLEKLNGNRTKAAAAMKVSIRCLRMHINRYQKAGFQIPESEYKSGFTTYWERQRKEETERKRRIDEYYAKHPEIQRLD